MRALWATILLAGCAARIGDYPDLKASCQTAGWYIDGPRQIALNREVTFRVVKCSNDVTPGQIMWSVSDGSVLRLVSSSSGSARVRAVQYGAADVVAMGPDGQFTLFVAVE